MDRAECAETVIDLQRQEIERLRADLAACIARCDAAEGREDKFLAERDAVAKRLENALIEGSKRREERDKLRADLAAANALLYGTKGEVSTTGALEEAMSFQRAWVAERTRAEKAEADLAAARELLKEARQLMARPDVFYDNRRLVARIDAAMKGNNE